MVKIFIGEPREVEKEMQYFLDGTTLVVKLMKMTEDKNGYITVLIYFRYE